jgi:hypothetical protein
MVGAEVPQCGRGPQFRHRREEGEMETGTTDGYGGAHIPAPGTRPPRLPAGTIARRVDTVIFGAALGVVLDFIVLVVSAFFALATWPAPCVGWQHDATRWLDRVAAIFMNALLLMIPAASTLRAVTGDSGQATGRRLRQWAIAVGSITGAMLVVYVLTLVAIGYVYHCTPSHNSCTYPFRD